MEITRTMPISYREIIEARLAVLNKTAMRLGMPALVLTAGEPFGVQVGPVSEWGPGRTEWRQEFTITGETPVMSGWTFVGTLEPAGDATIVRTVPGRIVPDTYRTASPDHCDHCNKKRARSQTFVVKNESGEHKQVGRACLKDFLGHDPAKVLSWITTVMSECEDGENGWGGVFASSDFDMMEVIAMTMLVLQTKPYCPANSHSPTRDEVSSMWHWHKLTPAELAAKRAAWESAGNLIASGKVQTMRDAMIAMPGDSDYAHNVRALSRLNYLQPKNLGYIVSAVHVTKKRLGEAVPHETRPEPNAAAVAAPGTKVKVVGTVLSAHKYERSSYSYYDSGVSQIVVLRDEASGGLVKHFTSNCSFDTGARIEISGTVKSCEVETFERSAHKGSVVTMFEKRARLKVIS